jgi:hypothetical protein
MSSKTTSRVFVRTLIRLLMSGHDKVISAILSSDGEKIKTE